MASQNATVVIIQFSECSFIIQIERKKNNLGTTSFFWEAKGQESIKISQTGILRVFAGLCQAAKLRGCPAAVSRADHEPRLLQPMPESEETLLSTALVKLSTHYLKITSGNRWQQTRACCEYVQSFPSSKVARPARGLFQVSQQMLLQREMRRRLRRKQTCLFRLQIFSGAFLDCFLHFPPLFT